MPPFGGNGASAGHRALVVGIDRYAVAIDQLPSCVADAGVAAALLRTTYGFEDVRELYDADATLPNLTQALADLCTGVGATDRVVFYFSGHGAQVVREGVLCECLVAQDLGHLYDEVLLDAAAGLPPGVLTVALDACFSGGLWKGLSAPKSRVVEASASKAAATCYRPFGGPARHRVGPFVAARKTLVVSPSPSEAAQPTLNGLLVAACLENETASASTPDTLGLSAFTFALTKAIAALGPHAPAAAVVARASSELSAIGVFQTPQLHEPSAPADMSGLTLYDAEAPSANVTVVVDPPRAGSFAPSPPEDAPAPADPLTTLAAFSAQAASSALSPSHKSPIRGKEDKS